MTFVSAILWFSLAVLGMPTYDEVATAHAQLCQAPQLDAGPARARRIRHLMPGLAITLDRRPRGARWNQHDHFVAPSPQVDGGADQRDDWARHRVGLALIWQRQPAPTSPPLLATTEPYPCHHWPLPDRTPPSSLGAQIDRWSAAARWRAHYHLSQSIGGHP